MEKKERSATELFNINKASVEKAFELLNNLQDPNFAQKIAELYKKEEHRLTPDFLTNLHQVIWYERGLKVGKIIKVEPCPYNQDVLEAQPKGIGYLPPELSTRETRPVFDKMFPEMKAYSVQVKNHVDNVTNHSGWFRYDISPLTYQDLDERSLLAELKIFKKRLLTLNEYIVASQDHKILTGNYLDEDVFVRVGARVNDPNYDQGHGLLIVHFNSRGALLEDLRPVAKYDKSSNLGARTTDS